MANRWIRYAGKFLQRHCRITRSCRARASNPAMPCWRTSKAMPNSPRMKSGCAERWRKFCPEPEQGIVYDRARPTFNTINSTRAHRLTPTVYDSISAHENVEPKTKCPKVVERIRLAQSA